MTVLLCGSSQTHLGTEMPSGGGHIIKAKIQLSGFEKSAQTIGALFDINSLQIGFAG
jgi:hypothetical protein